MALRHHMLPLLCLQRTHWKLELCDLNIGVPGPLEQAFDRFPFPHLPTLLCCCYYCGQPFIWIFEMGSSHVAWMTYHTFIVFVPELKQSLTAAVSMLPWSNLVCRKHWWRIQGPQGQLGGEEHVLLLQRAHVRCFMTPRNSLFRGSEILFWTPQASVLTCAYCYVHINILL